MYTVVSPMPSYPPALHGLPRCDSQNPIKPQASRIRVTKTFLYGPFNIGPSAQKPEAAESPGLCHACMRRKLRASCTDLRASRGLCASFWSDDDDDDENNNNGSDQCYSSNRHATIV